MSEYIVKVPKTITKLMSENNLYFPFIVKKITSYNVQIGNLRIEAGVLVTVTEKLQNLRWGDGFPNEILFRGYINDQWFDILDSEAWMLAEKSDDNVLSLNAYRKFKARKAGAKKR